MNISVVIPVYRTEQFIVPLHQRLSGTLKKIGGGPYEIIFVDDASPDQSWPVLQGLAAEDRHVLSIRLARNVGQHAAIAAGISSARGQWICVIDCDLQTPPELLEQLCEKAAAGAEIVMAKRITRQDDLVGRVGSTVFYWLVKLLKGIDLTAGYGTLSLISSKARERYLARPERKHCYLQIINSIPDLTRVAIEYRSDVRPSGKSAYSMKRLFRLVWNSLASNRNPAQLADQSIFTIAERVSMDALTQSVRSS